MGKTRPPMTLTGGLTFGNDSIGGDTDASPHTLRRQIAGRISNVMSDDDIEAVLDDVDDLVRLHAKERDLRIEQQPKGGRVEFQTTDAWSPTTKPAELADYEAFTLDISAASLRVDTEYEEDDDS